MNELALFAGGGGGILGGRLLGWHTVAAVEIEKYPREILLQRQRDGILPRFPIWDDVCSFDGRPWRGCVDVISGGFPCQDISVAGKGAGIEGERSGLWREMFRIVCEVRPRYVFVENSPMLVSRGLSVVLGDLAGAGYDAAWCVLGADDVEAPHVRKRIWLLAHDSHAHGVQCSEQGGEYARTEGAAGCGADELDAGAEVADSASERFQASKRQFANLSQEAAKRASDGAAGDCEDAYAADADVSGCEEQWGEESDGEEYAAAECGLWWSSEPSVGRVADGVAYRVDRLRAIGNGQVPLVAATAFKKLEKILNGHG